MKNVFQQNTNLNKIVNDPVNDNNIYK